MLEIVTLYKYTEPVSPTAVAIIGKNNLLVTRLDLENQSNMK